MSIKMTVNLPEQTVEALKNIAGDRGTTITEALRQVIESQRFLENEVQKGNSLLIQNPDKSLRQVVFNTPPKNSVVLGLALLGAVLLAGIWIVLLSIQSVNLRDTLIEQLRLDDAQSIFGSLKTVREGLDNSQRDIGALTQQARDQKDKLGDLTERLSGMENTEDEVKQKLARLASLQLEVTGSADEAHLGAQRATNDADAARTALESIEDDRKRVRNVASATVETATKLVLLMVEVEALEPRVKNLEQRTQKLEQPPLPAQQQPPQATKQSHLTRNAWKNIQCNRKARGFNPGRIDGLLGSNTTNAIMGYQKQRIADVTGKLTDDQVDELNKPCKP